MYKAYYTIEKFGQEYVSGWTKGAVRKVFGMSDTETKRMVNEVPA